MPFHPITLDTRTFNQAGVGLYSNSTVNFSSPIDLIKINGGKRNGTTRAVTATIQRVLEKDVTEGTDVFRRKATVTIQFSVPAGFTSTEVRAMLGDGYTFASVSNLDRVFMGDS